MSGPREVHAELLLGRVVCDAAGEKVGRLEEFRVDLVDGQAAVVEYHIGPAALWERIAGFVHQLPVFSRLPFSRRSYVVGWDAMDLSDPLHPRLLCAKGELNPSS